MVLSLVARTPLPTPNPDNTDSIVTNDYDSLNSDYGYYTGLRRPPTTLQALPRQVLTVHNQNNIQMTISNNGALGFADYYWSQATRDPFSGEKIATVHYPSGSGIRYQMNATLLIGAIVDGDTLVTSGLSEIYPDVAPFGNYQYFSQDANSPKYDSTAYSQMDIVCEFLDTNRVFASIDPRGHKPLGLRITQRSMVWTGDNIDDFVLVKYDMQNIGKNDLKKVYIGYVAHGGVNYHGEFDYTLSRYDDATGFLETYPAPEGCHTKDTLNIAYSFDLDGDPAGGFWAKYSPRAAVGIRFLDIPSNNWRVNYNWSNELGFRGPRFSPRRRALPGDPFRRDLPHVMNAMKDVDLYYHLANPEIDYDMMWTATNLEAQGWLPPPPRATNHTLQARPYYMISAGPFNMKAGERKTFAVAIVGGEKVHVNPSDFNSKFQIFSPAKYYESLDFSNLAKNARWAGWIYDNPGVDTDNDGYRGEFRVCNGDTTWYKGDGVPDLKADGPPQAPPLLVVPSESKITLRWNGYRTETRRDPFTNLFDFEGYRVYMGLDNRKTSLTLLSEYDRENFDRFRWVMFPDSSVGWVNEEIPFTIDSLRTMFNNPTFDPMRYTKRSPQTVGDSLYYYSNHGFNASSLCCNGEIHKVYPNATDPGTDPSLWTEDDVTYDHGEPLPKYFEYQYELSSLLPSIPYWFSVTAYDFGFAGGNIPSKESNPISNMVSELAQTPADVVEEFQLDAYVYPNPWRRDGNYSQRGYENRDGTQIPERSRRINFSNLPNVCKISIFSLDGDLVREIDHNFPEGGPGTMHDTWDMITRNAQLVVSGIYYWVIQSENRTQIGKFVIIR